MTSLSILWVDLCLCPNSLLAAYGLDTYYRVRATRFVDVGLLLGTIASTRPKVLCFDYDYPDLSGLHALKSTRRRFPRLPILMLTEGHSEDLAVWAFRSGVTEYLIKPIQRFDIQTRLDDLITLTDRADVLGILARDCPVPTEYRWQDRRKKLTQYAINFIEAHYHETIYVDTLARICGMSRSHFCRVFKAEQGEPFIRYLARCRISKAKDLLRRPSASVTEVAFAVGFSNHSHFTHTFRRFAGELPSDYRKRAQPSAVKAVHDEIETLPACLKRASTQRLRSP